MSFVSRLKSVYYTILHLQKILIDWSSVEIIYVDNRWTIVLRHCWGTEEIEQVLKNTSSCVLNSLQTEKKDEDLNSAPLFSFGKWP